MILVILGMIMLIGVYGCLLFQKKQTHYSLFRLLLGIYALGVISIVFFPFQTHDPLSFNELTRHINIVPLMNGEGQLINGLELSQGIMNAIMFIPLGILLPFATKKKLTLKQFVLICIGISLSIEILQLLATGMGLMMRACDINDVIFNTIGGTMSYGFINVIKECIFRQAMISQNEEIQ